MVHLTHILQPKAMGLRAQVCVDTQLNKAGQIDGTVLFCFVLVSLIPQVINY